MTHDQLREAALTAVRALFEDKSVAQVETATSLDIVIEEAQTLQATLSPEGDEGLVPDVRMSGSNSVAKWTLELPEEDN